MSPGCCPHRGPEGSDASSDTSYSQEHRTTNVGPSNYPKQPNRLRFVDGSEEEEQLPRRGGRDPRIANTPGNIEAPSKTDTATRNDTFADSSVSSSVTEDHCE